MKRSLFGLSLGLLLFVATSAYAEGQYYVSKSKSYSINFPEKWQIKEKAENGVEQAYAISPAESPDDKFLENMLISTESLPTKMTLDEFYQANIKGLKENFSDFAVEAEGKRVIDGVETRWIRYRASIMGLKAKAMQYLLLFDNSYMIITYAAPVETFDKFYEPFDKSVSSLKFLKKK